MVGEDETAEKVSFKTIGCQLAGPLKHLMKHVDMNAAQELRAPVSRSM